MTYREIIRTLLCGEAGEYVPEGLSFSFPLPSRNEDGELIDHFFLFAVDRSTRTPTTPYARLGIHAASGKLSYYHPETEYPFSSAAILRPNSIPYKEFTELVNRYEALYPKIRELTPTPYLSPDDANLLLDFFLLQFRLFGSQMGYYRQTASDFYNNIRAALGDKIMFTELLKSLDVRHEDIAYFTEMAETPVEKRKLIGITPEEQLFWIQSGYGTLRPILSARKNQLSVHQVADVCGTYHIAARSNKELPDLQTQPIPRERQEEIRNIARKLRGKYDLPLPMTLQDLESLAKKLGFQVEYQVLDLDIDGFVNLDSDTPHIVINRKPKSGYPPRKRFTLAHEIGHALIPWHVGTSRHIDDNESGDGLESILEEIQEKEVNIFASELLIPSDWLLEAMSLKKDLTELMEYVRHETGASILACLYALGDMLPEKEVLCIHSSVTEQWTFFRGPNTVSWASDEEAFALLNTPAFDKQPYRKGTYTVFRYRPKSQAAEMP